MSISIPAIGDALPAGMTLQEAAVRLAGGVCEAYAAYNNGSNLTPGLKGYKNINPIYVFEADPNGNPFSTSAAQEKAISPLAGRLQARVASQPAAYARGPGAANTACIGPTPIGTPLPGSQLFGFTATADDGSHNIFVLRGTVTLQEAGYDLLGWGDNTACLLPSQSREQKNYGNVNSYLLAFYLNDDWGAVTSLAASCLGAIQITSKQAPGLPWLMGAHSLGGAMLSLAALDANVSGLLSNPLVITFGSLHVGDGSFAKAYAAQVPASLRVANLCDFVPSMVSLEPVTLADPYVHVGCAGTFVWQTWDDWGNHSLANIYMPIVQSYWNVIQWGERKYPQ